jgi:signal transduction histidine kinase
LGLAIVQEIVRLHDGWVTVESEPEKGSTFIVWLPLSTHEESDQATVSTA